jgi:membrane associated rhomboid family serine protease
MPEDDSESVRSRSCPGCGTPATPGASNCEKCWRPLPFGPNPPAVAIATDTTVPRVNVPPLGRTRERDAPEVSAASVTASSTRKEAVGAAGDAAPATRRTTALLNARNALVVMLGIFAVLWIIQLINNADHYQLSIDYGIEPRRVADLPHILTSPFLHWSWSHIEGNSLPLLVLGFLVAYRGIPRFIAVTAIVVLTSGMAIWLTSPSGVDTVGASGVIFGWFGYVIVRGFFTRSKVDIVVGLLVVLYYLPIFTDLLPAPHLSYEGHIGGLIGGILCGWLFRTQRGPAPV